MLDNGVAWGLLWSLAVGTAWFLVLAATTRAQGLTYCAAESFDTLSMAYFVCPTTATLRDETNDDGSNEETFHVYQHL
jgi:hypothetical protein